MRKALHLKHRNLTIVFLGVAAVASWVLLAGKPEPGSTTATGGPRLVAIHPLPEIDEMGEMCQWMPASAGEEMFALAQTPSASSAAAADNVVRGIAFDRPPLRVIKDPYPTYSAVAIDMTNNEIVLQDENLFQIMAYDRMTNTPPTATMSEPKRVIGGHHTKVEFNCGLYIDPKTGDIYSVNNDTLDTLVIFNREARGDVPPTRELHTPHRTYGIAVDEAAQEMFLTVQEPALVVVYNKYAKGDDRPLRTLRGNATQMADAHGIALDTKRGLMFVANYGNAASYREDEPTGEVSRGRAVAGGNAPNTGGGDGEGGRVPGSGKFLPPSITVYPIKAQGNTAPIRVIQGPKTQFNWPAHISIDEERGEIYVANDGGHSILVFKVTDNGDVAPTRVIKGPKTQVKNPTGVFLDAKNDELVVANMGNHMATVYPRTASGDVAPLRVIRAAPADQPALQIGNPGAVAYDTKRDEILVPN
jgi:6-phosphogluconolactonase (cycloisomerase 2 family)